MAAPKGNEYNKIWKVKDSEEFLIDALRIAATNPNVHTVAELFQYFRRGEYAEKYKHRHLYEELFNDDRLPSRSKDCQSYKKEILTILKGRLINRGLTNEINSTMAIFIAKTNYGMIETSRQEIDNNINLEINTDVWEQLKEDDEE